MSQPALAPMTAEEFFAWGERQEERHELVDGYPAPMSGASRRHDRIVVNGLAFRMRPQAVPG